MNIMYGNNVDILRLITSHNPFLKYLKARRDWLHGDTAPGGISDASCSVDAPGERSTQSQGCKQHLYADKKVLIACWYGPSAACRLAVAAHSRCDDLCLLQHCQKYTYAYNKHTATKRKRTTCQVFVLGGLQIQKIIVTKIVITELLAY